MVVKKTRNRNTAGKPQSTKASPVQKPAEKPKPWSTKKSNRYFILFFFILSLVFYGNTVRNKFAVDDTYVTNNELVEKGFKAIPEIFSTFYVHQSGNIGTQSSDYRPIVKLTFAIEHGLWGSQKPFRSHLINILLYFWISVLLFFVLRRMLRSYNILFPFLITVLFLAHPVHTEVVASLKSRDELLAFLCGLGGLHYFLKYADTKKIVYPFLALIIIFIGYLSKSSILPFLVIYPLALYFFTDMNPRKFIFIFIACLSVFLLAQYIPRLFLPDPSRVRSYIENPLYFEKDFWIRIGTGFLSLWFYIKILFYPYPLLFYYGYNMIPITGPWNIWVLISIILHLIMFIIALRKFRRKHILSFAFLYYLIMISMYSNVLVPVVGIVGERFVFAASLGFCILIVYLLFRIFRTDPKSLTIEFNERAKIIVVVCLILIPYAALTIQRNRQWRNLFDLYRADIKHLDNSVKANIEYGQYLMSTVYNDPNFQEHGVVNEFKQQVIISHFKRAIELYPEDYKTLNDLATVYLSFTSKPDSALYYLNKAIALRPELQPAWVNLGLMYRKQQSLDSAMYCYEKVLQINPNELNAVFKLADLHFDKHEFDKAFQMNEEVMKSHPDLDIPYANVGFYHIALGDTLSCIKNWEEAVKRKPSYEICMNLSYLLKLKGEMERAKYYYEMGTEVQLQRNKQSRKKE